MKVLASLSATVLWLGVWLSFSSSEVLGKEEEAPLGEPLLAHKIASIEANDIGLGKFLEELDTLLKQSPHYKGYEVHLADNEYANSPKIWFRLRNVTVIEVLEYVNQQTAGATLTVMNGKVQLSDHGPNGVGSIEVAPNVMESIGDQEADWVAMLKKAGIRGFHFDDGSVAILRFEGAGFLVLRGESEEIELTRAHLTLLARRLESESQAAGRK